MSQLEFLLDFVSSPALKAPAECVDQLLVRRLAAIKSGKRRQLIEILGWIEHSTGGKSTPSELDAEAKALIAAERKQEADRKREAKNVAKAQARRDEVERSEREGEEYRAGLTPEASAASVEYRVTGTTWTDVIERSARQQPISNTLAQAGQ